MTTTTTTTTNPVDAAIAAASSTSLTSAEPFVTDESIQQLRKDLSIALSAQSYYDTTIIVESQRFQAHRVILANRSKFFDDILQKMTKEANAGEELIPKLEIDLKDVSPDINVPPTSFAIILKYLYNGELYITHENCLDIYSLSRQLKLESAERVCNEYLERMKKGAEVCGLLKAALDRNEDELFHQCMKSFEEKTAECFESEMFLTVPEQVIDEVLKSEKIVCTEKNLFDAIIRWWGANKDDILPNASKHDQDKYLLDNYLYYIRYPLMDPSEVIEIERMNLIPEDYILQALRFNVCHEENDASLLKAQQEKADHDDEDLYSTEDFRTRVRTESLITFTFDPKKIGADMTLDSKHCSVEISKANVQSYQMALATKGVSKGVHIFEVVVDACTSSSHIMIGVSTGKNTVRQWLRQDKTGWGWVG
mmetsp:Transcript_877/g.3041  ORF Transcript_877/g.3041 Transcript_877/m.3041 type:complete len:424 (-) Transcript_877:2-1273(-)